ncbi:MAG: DUF3969 family protein [Lachnospiraceae bacterium]
MFRFTNKTINKMDEKFLLINIVGLLYLLEIDTISIDEAEKILFSPYICKMISDKGCNKKLVELLWKTCELEDIKSIIPEHYYESVVEIKNEAIMLFR